MARPVTVKTSPHVQVNIDHSQPELGVYAPMDVNVPHAGFDGLRQLMTALSAFGQGKQQRDDAWYKRGQADAQLGQVDKTLTDKHRRYSDGAFEVATLQSYQDAERATAEWTASEEFDKTLPIDRQVELVDDHMKARLEGFLHDPRSRGVIASRYQQFINTFASNAAASQAQAHAQAAVETTTQDLYDTLDRTGTIDWIGSVHRLATQTGDPVKANETVLGVVLQRMEDTAAQGGDYKKLRELIPTETLGPNGQKLPGPMYNPRYRAMVQASEARSEQLFDKFNKQQYAAGEFTARTELDAMVRSGVPITPDTFKDPKYAVGDGPEYPLTPALAAAYIDASNQARAKAAAKAATYDGYLAARQMYGSWRNSMYAPGGPDSEEKANDAFTQWPQTTALGMGIPVEKMGGNGLLADRAVMTNFVNLAAQEGMTYKPLKEALSGISQAAPGDIVSRLDAYQLVKEKGVAPQYVDDQASAVYEAALGAREAGVTKEQMPEFIRTLGDKTTAQAVSAQMSKLKVRTEGFDVVTEAGLFHDSKINSTQTLNAPYLAGKVEELTAYALAKDMPLEKAQAWAIERVQQSTVALPVGGSWMVVPKDAIQNPKDASDALQWYEEQLPAIGKKLDIPDDELSIHPVFDMNGRGLSFEVRRYGILPVADPFTLPGLVDTWRRDVPESDPKARALKESHDRRERREAFEEQRKTTPIMRGR